MPFTGIGKGTNGVFQSEVLDRVSSGVLFQIATSFENIKVRLKNRQELYEVKEASHGMVKFVLKQMVAKLKGVVGVRARRISSEYSTEDLVRLQIRTFEKCGKALDSVIIAML